MGLCQPDNARAHVEETCVVAHTVRKENRTPTMEALKFPLSRFCLGDGPASAVVADGASLAFRI